MRLAEEKIKTKGQIKKIVRNLRSSTKKIVFTNGCFDILHYGHVYYLEQARLLGDVLIVGVNSDASVRRLKGPQRPINKLRDRMYVLAGLEAVDYVVSFREDTPLSLIVEIKPDVLVKGGDWEIEQIVGAKEVLSWGGEVRTITFKKGRSTTAIINKIIFNKAKTHC